METFDTCNHLSFSPEDNVCEDGEGGVEQVEQCDNVGSSGGRIASQVAQGLADVAFIQEWPLYYMVTQI